MKSKIALLLFAFLYINKIQAQIQVSDASIPPFTPENLISNYFLGEGVKVLSIKYEGKNTAVGYFDKAKANVGIQRGIVMSTGRITDTPALRQIGGGERRKPLHGLDVEGVQFPQLAGLDGDSPG